VTRSALRFISLSAAKGVHDGSAFRTLRKDRVQERQAVRGTEVPTFFSSRLCLSPEAISAACQ
jgi:hypothetical protein